MLNLKKKVSISKLVVGKKMLSNNFKLKIIISSSSKTCLSVYINHLKKLYKEKDLLLSISSIPTTKKRITLLKSPHVNKKAKEHFEIKTFKTVISLNSSREILYLKKLLCFKPKSLRIKVMYKDFVQNV